MKIIRASTLIELERRKKKKKVPKKKLTDEEREQKNRDERIIRSLPYGRSILYGKKRKE